ncbi:MAG: flagellar filament capping protein FliD [Negativicutes bacterium]|nr:flagellar filament capping protein FliD [Negativicutes bacterium]
MTIRTYGLSGSGMDVDQMVKDLMKARRAQYDKMYQKKTQLEYKKQDYNTMYTALKDFREKDVFNFRMSSQLNPKKATLADSSLATVTANSDAVSLNHSLEVTALAASARTESAGAISQGDKSSLLSQFNLDAGTSAFTITINDGVNAAKSIQVDPGKSINDLVAAINNAGTNIRATYDSVLDKFYMYNTKTGGANKLQITDANVTVNGEPPETKGFFAGVLGVSLDVAGADAKIKIDGVELSRDTNVFTVSGLTFDLKKTGVTTLDVASDIDKTVENVKAFVASYNAIVQKVNSELKEAYYRDYQPLTAEQKKEMKDDEIKAWEEKAKSGMLKNDTTLRRVLDAMRLDFAAPVSGVSGKYKSAVDIGLNTSSYIDETGNFVDVSSLAGGLSIDETKLRKALAEDPDIVSKIFAADSSDHKSKGVSRRLYDTLKEGIDDIVETAGRSADLVGDTESSLAKQIRDMAKRMDAENDRLARLESRYYKQFDAMEAAIQRLSQQSAWFAQQMGTGQ